MGEGERERERDAGGGEWTGAREGRCAERCGRYEKKEEKKRKNNPGKKKKSAGKKRKSGPRATTYIYPTRTYQLWDIAREGDKGKNVKHERGERRTRGRVSAIQRAKTLARFAREHASAHIRHVAHTWRGYIAINARVRLYLYTRGGRLQISVCTAIEGGADRGGGVAKKGVGPSRMVCQGRRRERRESKKEKERGIEGMDGRGKPRRREGENRNAEKDSITHNEGKEDTGLG